MEESVEDALRDLGIEMPKPAAQAWHYNPRMPRSVPSHEQKGEYLLLLLTILEDGSPKDNLNFDALDAHARTQLGAIVYKELCVKVDAGAAEIEGKAMVGHVVQGLQKALATFAPTPAAHRALLSFDRAEKQGNRPSMEDKMVLVPDVNAFFAQEGLPAQSFFGIFDGHAGVDAARFAQAHLLQHIASHPHFIDDLPTALKGAHASLDEALASKPTRSGCTAITAFVRGDTVHLSWLGDSAAVLCRGGEPVTLMEAHKPGRADEKQRIEAAGGMVMQVFGVWRVNGVLSVARALGDHNMKTFVISDPDVHTFALDGKEDFLVLACDGLWDVMTPEEVVAYVKEHTQRDESGAAQHGVAGKLSDHAIALGSSDNVSIIIAYFSRPAAAAPAAAGGAASA